MDCPLCLKIALGTTKGLAYLHSNLTTNTPIIHRDFKSTNILLDAGFPGYPSPFSFFSKGAPLTKQKLTTCKIISINYISISLGNFVFLKFQLVASLLQGALTSNVPFLD